MDKKYWDKFTIVHSQKTCEYVSRILGTNVKLENFISEHLKTCKAKNRKLSCAKRLHQFLNKFHYLNQNASSD